MKISWSDKNLTIEIMGHALELPVYLENEDLFDLARPRVKQFYLDVAMTAVALGAVPEKPERIERLSVPVTRYYPVTGRIRIACTVLELKPDDTLKLRTQSTWVTIYPTVEETVEVASIHVGLSMLGWLK